MKRRPFHERSNIVIADPLTDAAAEGVARLAASDQRADALQHLPALIATLTVDRPAGDSAACLAAGAIAILLLWEDCRAAFAPHLQALVAALVNA